MEAKKLGEWMVKAQAGDKVAYRKLLEALRPEIERIIRSKINDSFVVEDIAQAALLKIHVSRHTYKPEFKFSSWINAIVRNLMIDHFKKGGKEDTAFTHIDPRSDHRIEGKVDSESEDTIHIMHAMDRLDEKYKRVLELLGVQGLSIKEAAETLGITEAAVKMRKKRAIENLRDNLKA